MSEEEAVEMADWFNSIDVYAEVVIQDIVYSDYTPDNIPVSQDSHNNTVYRHCYPPF